ncbi:MAG: TetR/AcrR family transcriptional regulator [Actinomycetota bacterium]|nr:TetR/AcrR family transcriptional regulator [Actinomycetota bacterium]
MTTAEYGRAPRGTRLARPARRKQLLEAAHELFVEHGYHAAAMDDIAERAGVSKPVLYQHFPSKLELYCALLDQHAEHLLAKVRRALDSTTDNRARVAASVAAYFDFVDGKGSDVQGAFRLVFESDLRNDPAVRERVERMTRGCADAIAETIAHDTGYRPEEAQLLSIGLTGLMEVSARWWLTSADRIPKDRAVELLLGLAWRGISGSPRAV